MKGGGKREKKGGLKKDATMVLHHNAAKKQKERARDYSEGKSNAYHAVPRPHQGHCIAPLQSSWRGKVKKSGSAKRGRGKTRRVGDEGKEEKDRFRSISLNQRDARHLAGEEKKESRRGRGTG